MCYPIQLISDIQENYQRLTRELKVEDDFFFRAIPPPPPTPDTLTVWVTGKIAVLSRNHAPAQETRATNGLSCGIKRAAWQAVLEGSCLSHVSGKLLKSPRAKHCQEEKTTKGRFLGNRKFCSNRLLALSAQLHTSIMPASQEGRS